MKISLQTLLAALLIASLPVPQAQAQATWPERISFDGDFRLRYESIDAEGSPGRDRSRFRARFGIAAKASEDIKLVFRLATGDGSPVSTNLTFDDGFSAKQIQVDRAYVDWSIDDRWNLRAGKMSMPWFRPGGTPLIWDGDLNPEGAALMWKSGPFFGSVALMAVEERSAADDSMLYTLQGGWEFELADGNSLTAGLSYFSYSDTVGNVPFYNGSANGNSVDLNGNYINDYRIVELFAEYKGKLGELPLTLYADFAQNSDVSTEDSAFAIGANFGSAKKPGDWQFGYAWHDTEADAVIGTYSDSDFAGGRTDSNGHFIKSKYALRDNVALGGTLILSERGAFAGDERDYDRIMLDIEFNFE